jgi:hypothetical protein
MNQTIFVFRNGALMAVFSEDLTRENIWDSCSESIHMPLQVQEHQCIF